MQRLSWKEDPDLIKFFVIIYERYDWSAPYQLKVALKTYEAYTAREAATLYREDSVDYPSWTEEDIDEYTRLVNKDLLVYWQDLNDSIMVIAGDEGYAVLQAQYYLKYYHKWVA